VEGAVTEDPFRLRRVDVVRVLAIGLGQAATLVAFLLLIRAIVDSLAMAAAAPWAAPVDRSTTWKQVGALVAVVLLHGWLRAGGFSLAEKIGYDVVRRVRMQMYGHLQGMTPRQIQARSRGGLLLRFIGDLSMLRMWISRGLLGGIVALIVLCGATGVLLALNPTIAVSMLGLLAGGAAISLTSGRTMRRATRTMRRRRSLLSSNIDEQVNALPVVQVFGRARGEYSRLSRQNDSLNRSLHLVAELRGRLRGISSAVSLLVAVVVLAVGIVEINKGRATLGLVIATLTVARQLTGPIRTLGLAHDYWHRSRISRQKVLEFLHSSSNTLADPQLAPLRVRKGAIEFRNVSVPGALSDVTLAASPGQIVAVTGPTGAGKSTLLGLVARLVDPITGEVAVDGQVLSKTTPQSTFRQFGMVGAELPLMRGTVRRNLTYRDPRASEEEVRRVVDVTGLDEVLAELPSGLTTWVTEGGRNLSAGQRQRIALGRAVLGNPPILLLDEPSTNLDPVSKAAIREVISRHHGTVLLVTHDTAEMSLADQVWVLDRGRVVDVVSGEDYRDRLWAASQQGSAWQAGLTV
jgi:ATP-binding cassette, subfamily B, bacterial